MAFAAIRPRATPAAAPSPGPARVGGWPWLSMEWVVRSADTLPGLPAGASPEARRFLVLHAAHGVVILDLWRPADLPPGEAVPPLPPAALDAEFRLAGFLRRFDPRLPAHRIHLAEPELPRLAEVLARAFAEAEPLQLPGGESWVGAVQAALAAPPPPAPAESRPRRPRPVVIRHRPGARRAAIGIAATIVLLAIGGRFLAERPRPPAAVDITVARMEPSPEPEAPPIAAIAEVARIAPLPEPEAAHLAPLAIAEAAGTEPFPEPEAPELPPLAAMIAEAVRVEPFPEPEAAQLPPLATMVAEAVRAEPFPEPETAYLPPLVVEPDGGAAPLAVAGRPGLQAEPLPEPTAAASAAAPRAGRPAGPPPRGLAMARPAPPIHAARPSRTAPQAAPPQAHAAAADASSRCRAIVLHVQLGEELSHADRGFLRAGCAQRR